MNNTTYLDPLSIKLNIGQLIIDITYIRYEAPRSTWKVPYHCHQGYELHFVPKGKGYLYSKGKAYRITPNTFYMTGPSVYHCQETDTIDPMEEYCINFNVELLKLRSKDNMDFLKDETDEIINSLLSNDFWFGKDKYKSYRIFENIFKEIENKQVGYYTNIKNYISQIIINEVRCYVNKKKASYSLPLKTIDDRRKDIIDTFFNECQNELNIETLAKELAVSVRQLNRILTSLYSMSFKEKLLWHRIEESKGLLKTSELSISSIAKMVGFQSSSYFSRAFKNNTGLSPQEYKAK
jgi:AraC-like DNA-binding protein